jgi:endonuclease/exonuclease/phosphatase family metal-dependent hydrolase
MKDNKLLIILLLVFFTFHLINFSFSAAPSDSTKKTDDCGLKILSWNIYMLPAITMPLGIGARAKLIAEYLKNNDYDIVVFQEAFHPKARRIIRRILGELYEYEIGPANKWVKTSYRTNSGLWILSKIPLINIGEIEFKRSSGFDRFSRKGALMVEGIKNGVTFQIVNTHLNAGSDQTIRDSQYQEVYCHLIEPNRTAGVPQILCGDFNTNKSDKENYPKMIEMLSVPDYDILGTCLFSCNGLKNDLTDYNYNQQDLIDYIFVNLNGQIVKKIERKIHEVTEKWSIRHKDLSDHYPVTALIQF